MIGEPINLGKKLLMTVQGREKIRPPGIDDFVMRKGITNPAVVVDAGKVTMLARLIYDDSQGENSAIVRYNGEFGDGDIRIFPEEEVIFPPEEPFGKRGVEDFRTAGVEGEMPTHGFSVHHDGIDARTEYLRTKEAEPGNLSNWDRFGIWFPNISVPEALDLVPDRLYRDNWMRAHYLQKFLPTKDCSLWPKKVDRLDSEGESHKYYGVITRLFPEMQMVYVRDFKQLASREFWQETVRNIEEHTLLKREYGWERSHIGLAGQPVEIDEGMLIFYHGARLIPEKDYQFGVALADKKNPQKIIARTRVPLLKGTEPWEMTGKVMAGRIVFPTAHINLGDTIGHFYGASDDCIAYCQTSLDFIKSRLEPV